MNCLTVAALVMRLASSDHGAAPAALVQTECGIEIGVARERGVLSAEAGERLSLPHTPFFVRGALQAWRANGAPPAPTLVPHGSGISPQVYSVQLVPIDAGDRRWRLRERFTVGAAIPVGGFSALVEVEPARGEALISLRFAIKGAR